MQSPLWVISGHRRRPPYGLGPKRLKELARADLLRPDKREVGAKKPFTVGDHVAWNSEAGFVSGKIRILSLVSPIGSRNPLQIGRIIFDLNAELYSFAENVRERHLSVEMTHRYNGWTV
jgi:hypothetical protein